MDMSRLSDDDLQAIASGDMTNVSDKALGYLASGGKETYAPKRAPQQDAIDEMGGGKKLLTGIGAGMYDAFKGVQQLGATIGNKVGLVDDSTVKRITQEGMDARADFAPLGGQSTLASVGDFVGKVAPSLALPGGVAGGMAKRAVTAGLAGAAQGLADFVPENGSRAANVLMGGLGGAAGSAAISGIGKAINTFKKPLNKLQGEAGKIQNLSEQYGIPTTYSELTGKGNHVDTLMERIPGALGITGFREQQQQAVKDAAFKQFSKYMVDPSIGTTAEMKAANDVFLGDLFEKVKTTGAAMPKAQAPAIKAEASDLLDRFPSVFESIQDSNIKRILRDVKGDTATQNVNTGILNQSGNPVIRQVEPEFAFNDLWELRKGIGREIGSAPNDIARGQLNKLYGAVSDDIDNMLGPQAGMFKEANDAFKQYSVKFDVMRKAYDNAIGGTSGQRAGFFSPAKYSTELKKLASDPAYKKNVKFSDTEIKEMTGLANILYAAKRAGQYLENPPTGARFIPSATSGILGAGGAAQMLGMSSALPAAVGTIATGVGTSAIVKFLTTTNAGKKMMLSSSKIEPNSKSMKVMMQMIYRQLPKFTAEEMQGNN